MNKTEVITMFMNAVGQYTSAIDKTAESNITYKKSVYALEDADRQILASELKTLDISDESFATYQEKLGVIWKHKNKEHAARLAEEAEARINAEVEKRLLELNKSTASVVKTDAELAEEALENAKASEKEIVPNNNGTSTEGKSFKEKFASAFSRENITIS